MSETLDKTIIIKRYASRKLYDPQAKVYVTLDDVARYIAEGHTVRIVDKKTDEDLTSQYLVQIIAERENKGDSPLPVSVLTDLVRLYHDRASALTPTFLSQAVEAFAEQQKKVVETISDPVRAVSAMQQWQAQQVKLFGKALDVATGGLSSGLTGGLAGSLTSRSKSAAKPKAPVAPGNDARIDALEAQLSALQSELQKLK